MSAHHRTPPSNNIHQIQPSTLLSSSGLPQALLHGKIATIPIHYTPHLVLYPPPPPPVTLTTLPLQQRQHACNQSNPHPRKNTALEREPSGKWTKNEVRILQVKCYVSDDILE